MIQNRQSDKVGQRGPRWSELPMDRPLATLVGAYGSTDAEGAKIESGPVTVPDLFATIATRLGIDPKREQMSPCRPTDRRFRRRSAD